MSKRAHIVAGLTADAVPVPNTNPKARGKRSTNPNPNPNPNLRSEWAKPWYAINSYAYATWCQESQTWTELWDEFYDSHVRPRILAWKFVQRHNQVRQLLNRGSKKRTLNLSPNLDHLPLILEKSEADFQSLDPYQRELVPVSKPRGEGLCPDCGIRIGGKICIAWAGLGCETEDCAQVHDTVCQCDTEIRSLTWEQRLAKANELLDQTPPPPPELGAVATKARDQAMAAIRDGVPNPGPFTFRESVREAERQRASKSAARYAEWRRDHARSECEWFISHATLCSDAFWHNAAHIPILKYWNSRVGPELRFWPQNLAVIL